MICKKVPQIRYFLEALERKLGFKDHCLRSASVRLFAGSGQAVAGTTDKPIAALSSVLGLSLGASSVFMTPIASTLRAAVRSNKLQRFCKFIYTHWHNWL